MLVKFQLVVVLKVIYQNMPLYLASAFPFSLQGCPTIAGQRPASVNIRETQRGNLSVYVLRLRVVRFPGKSRPRTRIHLCLVMGHVRVGKGQSGRRRRRHQVFAPWSGKESARLLRYSTSQKSKRR